MSKKPLKGAVRFPDDLWSALESAAKARRVPVEVLVVAEMSRWCHSEMGAAVPTATILLPDDIERCDNATGFVGVYKNGSGFKAMWDKASLGTYPTPEEAALVRHREKVAHRKRINGLIEGDSADEPDPDVARAGQPPPVVRLQTGRYKCPFCFDWVRGSCPKCGTMTEAREKADAEKAAKEARANPVADAAAPA